MSDDQNRGNPNADQNLTDDDRRKGGQTSSSNQDMGELGRKGGQSSGQGSQPTTTDTDIGEDIDTMDDL